MYFNIFMTFFNAGCTLNNMLKIIKNKNLDSVPVKFDWLSKSGLLKVQRLGPEESVLSLWSKLEKGAGPA